MIADPVSRRAFGLGSAMAIGAAAGPAQAQPRAAAGPWLSFHEFLTAAEIGATADPNNTLDLSAALAKARAQCAAARLTPALVFPAGVYRYSRSPDWGFPGAHIEGAGRAILRHVGSGDAFIATDAATVGLFGLRFSGLTIEAGASTRHGIYLSSIHHAALRDLQVRGCSGTALRIDFSVCSLVEHFVCSHNRQGGGKPGFHGGARPRVGIGLGRGGPGREPVSYTTFLNPIIEGPTIGAVFEAALGCAIIGGTLEGCPERGLVIEQASRNNRVQFTDFEANGIEDVLNRGLMTELLNTDCRGGTTFAATAVGGSITGGQHNRVTLAPGSKGVLVDFVAWNEGGKGSFTNGGMNRVRDRFDVAAGRLTSGQD